MFPPRILKDYEVLYTTPDGLNARTAIWSAFKAA